MDDAVRVGVVERPGELRRDAQRLVRMEPRGFSPGGAGTPRNPRRQRLAFDQLHHQVMDGRTRHRRGRPPFSRLW